MKIVRESINESLVGALITTAALIYLLNFFKELLTSREVKIQKLEKKIIRDISYMIYSRINDPEKSAIFKDNYWNYIISFPGQSIFNNWVIRINKETKILIISINNIDKDPIQLTDQQYEKFLNVIKQIKVIDPDSIPEGYGAGFTPMSGYRGGFGGANNLGGPNMMYTYEIKPLNHTLEQRPNMNIDQIPEIRIGSKIRGSHVLSNAYPDDENKIVGIVRKIILSNNGSFKYYVVQDEATQQLVNVEPLSAELLINDPMERYFDPTQMLPSRRKQKLKAFVKEEYVSPSIQEFIKKKEV